MVGSTDGKEVIKDWKSRCNSVRDQEDGKGSFIYGIQPSWIMLLSRLV